MTRKSGRTEDKMKVLIYYKYLTYIIACILLGSTTASWAQPPVPSRWQGEIKGTVYNKPFTLMVELELKRALPHENNPFHLFIGAGNPQNMGHLFLSSAIQKKTSSVSNRIATLQYLTIYQQGNRLQATLTNDHRAEAAKANGFSGPNVSAAEASDLMRDILKNAWGNSEMFGFSRGASLLIQFNSNGMSGTIQGRGSSYTATSSTVQYQAQFQARRIQ